MNPAKAVVFRPQRATWNPSDKATDITLSNANRSAANATFSFSSVRGTLAKSSGKWAFEVLVDVLSGGNGIFVGIGTAAMGLTNDVGHDAFGWAYRDSGVRNHSGTLTPGYATFTAGDAITVYFDAGAGKVWWAKNGTVQGGGDPGAGTLPGYSTGAITAYPALSTSGNGKVTIRATAYALPTGFAPW